VIAASALAGFLVYRRFRRMRKSHGEYRPQAEESLYAKKLPYINPPNIGGLI